MAKVTEINIDSIKYYNKNIIFKRPICIKQSFENDIWEFECKEINAMGYDYNFDEAWEIFKESIVVELDTIGKEDDAKLSPKARELKKVLNELIEVRLDAC